LSVISKDSPFNVINALQISFNYLCLFKSYFWVPTLSEYSMGEFVYAVTAAEGVILSLFTSNEQ